MTRVGIITDSRRTPLYQPGLVERLTQAFVRGGAQVQVLDMASDEPAHGDFDVLYPMPVISSSRLLYFLETLTTPHHAWLVNSPTVQLASLDKLRTFHLLRAANVPYPETIETEQTEEVLAFVERHGCAILKSPTQVAGLGHAVVEAEGGHLYSWVPNVARHRQLAGTSSVLLGEAAWRLPVSLRGSHPGDHLDPPSGEHVRLTPTLHAPFFVQRFVGEETRGRRVRDRVYRVYWAGGRALFGSARVMKPISNGTLSYAIVNYAWGGKYELFSIEQLPVELVAIGCAAAEALGLDAGAVDLIEDEEGRWLVLEGETDNFVYHLCRGYRNAEGEQDRFSFNEAVADFVLAKVGDRQPTVVPFDDIRAILDLLDGTYSPSINL
ncbi:MAG: RimK-like ATP-grasp domain [Acidobacteriota bacterium]|jgi:glutathione synthase/RimK-type ligase-like ATP-grasp enzyme|nr:RimK-like ATP-grasp domain [Acidobacteriota bacterium]